MPETEDIQIKVKIKFPFVLNLKKNIDAKPATPKRFSVSTKDRSNGEDSSDLI